MIPFGIGLGGSPDRYLIPRSLRFNSADSAYLSRTPGAAGNRKTWTFSAWVKRASITTGVSQCLFSARADANNTAGLYFYSATDDNLGLFASSGGAAQASVQCARLFRDPSAWLHIVVALDTSQATEANRAKFYVNGEQQTLTFPTTLAQNADLQICNNVAHGIGYLPSPSAYFSGYMADAYLIDGQQLTPSAFGMTDPSTGQWVPIDASGISRGTTGFFLNFADNTSTTTLGYDQGSGSNDWALNNFSVAAGAGNDSLTDTPTNNYCTWNPLDANATAFTNGMLDISTAAGYCQSRASFGMSSGKWYWEITENTAKATVVGIGTAASTFTDYNDAYSWSYNGNTGNKTNNKTEAAFGVTWTTGDVIGVAYDADNGKVFFSKNGTWQNSGDPVAGTGYAYASLTGTMFPIIGDPWSSDALSATANFGQRAFAATPPSGFKALCSENLTSDTVTASGTFTGNADANGPFVFANGVGATLTLNGNAVTFGTHADKLANGFKLRTASASYNASGSNTWAWTAGRPFRRGNAQGNP
jgi:hypothetical protein